MGFKAYGTNLRTEDYELIRRMAKIVTHETIEVVDTNSYEVEIHPEDIVFVYGERAYHLTELYYTKRDKVIFPDVAKLDSEYGESRLREAAYELLLKTKEKLNQPVGQIKKIDEEVLRLLTQKDLVQLEADLRVKEVDSWQCETGSGRVVRLTLDPEISTADISLTFREAYALKTVAEVLQATSVELIPRSKQYMQDDTG